MYVSMDGINEKLVWKRKFTGIGVFLPYASFNHILYYDTEAIVNMTYNKAMNISVWVTSDGRVHFVKCHKSQSRSRRGSKETSDVRN